MFAVREFSFRHIENTQRGACWQGSSLYLHKAKQKIEVQFFLVFYEATEALLKLQTFTPYGTVTRVFWYMASTRCGIVTRVFWSIYFGSSGRKLYLGKGAESSLSLCAHIQVRPHAFSHCQNSNPRSAPSRSN